MKDSIFERMMFGDSVNSLESTSREYEVELYADGADIEHLRTCAKAYELHEQWGVYIPRASSNVSDGRIRSRYTLVYERDDPDVASLWKESEHIYQITLKTSDEDGDLESEIIANKGLFTQMSLMSDSGMIKERLSLPYQHGDILLTAEIDVFRNDQGDYLPWIKIDVEYPEGMNYLSNPFPPEDLMRALGLPKGSKFYFVTPEMPKDDPVRKQVKSLYDKYFLKPNKHL